MKVGDQANRGQQRGGLLFFFLKTPRPDFRSGNAIHPLVVPVFGLVLDKEAPNLSSVEEKRGSKIAGGGRTFEGQR